MKKELTREEFDILIAAIEKKVKVEASSSVYQNLKDAGYLDKNGITLLGKEILEPYRAKRAILVAAGMGSRLVPITLNTPKPLVRVNGVRIIDTLLDAILAAGIEEIYIVRGYLSKQFDQLLEKYPMIRFLENDHYATENNISSIMCAIDFLQDTYILEADLLLRNPKLVRPYHYTCNYLGIKMTKTDDWCFTVRNNVIQGWKVGGTNCYQEVGISYWDTESGEKLKKHIKVIYEKSGGKDLFWDQVPLVDFQSEYKIEICECQEFDVIEIDTISDLRKIDPNYNV